MVYHSLLQRVRHPVRDHRSQPDGQFAHLSQYPQHPFPRASLSSSSNPRPPSSEFPSEPSIHADARRENPFVISHLFPSCRFTTLFRDVLTVITGNRTKLCSDSPPSRVTLQHPTGNLLHSMNTSVYALIRCHPPGLYLIAFPAVFIQLHRRKMVARGRVLYNLIHFPSGDDCSLQLKGRLGIKNYRCNPKFFNHFVEDARTRHDTRDVKHPKKTLQQHGRRRHQP